MKLLLINKDKSMNKEQSELKTASQLINDERERHISKEGWTIEHDNQHIYGELLKAAECYYYFAEDNNYEEKIPLDWPWEKEWWKPKNQLQDYVRAGALYLAELHRLERTGGAVGPKLTNIRIGIRQCEIRIEEIIEHEAYCAKKSKDSSPIEGVKEAAEKFVEERKWNLTHLSEAFEAGAKFGANRISQKEGELREENERLRNRIDELERALKIIHENSPAEDSKYTSYHLSILAGQALNGKDLEC